MTNYKSLQTTSYALISKQKQLKIFEMGVIEVMKSLSTWLNNFREKKEKKAIKMKLAQIS